MRLSIILLVFLSGCVSIHCPQQQRAEPKFGEYYVYPQIGETDQNLFKLTDGGCGMPNCAVSH